MLLVTGAAGYVGAALVAELVRRGLPVRAAVRDLSRVSMLPGTVQRVRADLDDEASLRAAVAGCDGVFHVAAVLRPSPVDTARGNVDGTARLLRAAADAGVTRFVYTSSTAAIIDATGLVNERVTETALPDPYATSKAAAERLVLAAAADGMPAVIVNPTCVYGPSPAGPLSYNTLLLAAARGEVSEVVDTPVGWVLAEDVAAAHVLAYERGVTGAKYALCGEVASYPRVLNTYAELAGSPYRVAGLPPGSTLGPDPQPYAYRSEVYGKLPPVRVDDSQARALGFTPRPLADGLRHTATWLSSLS
ncbi:MAG: dihydroflavonol-4-reductase [Mycobacteriales bacterium]|jgi:dihydroflavonol-4-reductase